MGKLRCIPLLDFSSICYLFVKLFNKTSGKSEVNESLDRDDTCILIFIYKSKAGQLNVFILILVEKRALFHILYAPCM